jgi:diacylglycerol kinase (ATP)
MRVAFRDGRSGAVRRPAYSRGVAREITILTNPSSGKGRGREIAEAAADRLSRAGCQVRCLTGANAGESRSMAQRAVDDEVDSLVVVGGDGMVNLAAQAVVGSATTLGVLPAGTGNDVARSLGIPRSDADGAVDVVLGSRTRRVDVARAGTRYFVTVLAAGFDAVVNERANAMSWPRGRLRYTVATASELRVFRPLSYTLDLDGSVHRLEAMLVAVGNGPSFGGGLRITHGASMDDGWLDVVVIKPMSKAELVRTYPRLYRGGHTRHRQYEHHRVRSVTLAGPDVVAYADGERFEPLPVTVEVVPRALEILVPDPEEAHR